MSNEICQICHCLISPGRLSGFCGYWRCFFTCSPLFSKSAFAMLWDPSTIGLMPFSLSSAPLVFTRVLAPVLALLYSSCIPIMGYLDNFLLREQSAWALLNNVTLAVLRLQRIAWILNFQKLSLETDSSFWISGTSPGHSLGQSVPSIKETLKTLVPDSISDSLNLWVWDSPDSQQLQESPISDSHGSLFWARAICPVSLQTYTMQNFVVG